MTDRERWIVYPLLFLALGVSLRDKLTESVSSRSMYAEDFEAEQLSVLNGSAGNLQVRSIQCRELTVVGSDGRPKVRLASGARQAGEVQVLGAGGRPTVSLSAGADGQTGNVVVYAADGTQIRLHPTVRPTAPPANGSPATGEPAAPRPVPGPK